MMCKRELADERITYWQSKPGMNNIPPRPNKRFPESFDKLLVRSSKK
jgi:hypothetical protein